MPCYEYKCPSCQASNEVWQTMEEPHEIYPCSCGEMAQRVWTVPVARIEDSTPYFNHGLGVWVKGKQGVKDELARIHDTTGRVVTEVGNEKIKAKPVEAHYPTAAELGY